MTVSPETLQALVDAEDIDGLLEVVSVDDIAAAWCRYWSRPRVVDPDWWAYALFFTSGIFRRRELHRRLLLALIDHASDDVLGAVGAGPLEDFVSDDDGNLRWLERHCAENPRLAQALAGVWCDGLVSEQTMARLDAAAGTPLARTPPNETWRPEQKAVDDAHRRLMAVVGSDWDDVDRVWTPEERDAIRAYLRAFGALVDLVTPEADTGGAE